MVKTGKFWWTKVKIPQMFRMIMLNYKRRQKPVTSKWKTKKCRPENSPSVVLEYLRKEPDKNRAKWKTLFRCVQTRRNLEKDAVFG